MHANPRDQAFWRNVPAEYLRPLVEEELPTTVFALGDPDDPQTPAAVVFKAPPGHVLDRHSHDCHRFEILLVGSMETEAGHVSAPMFMTAGPNEMYGPHVAGPEGYTVVEVFSALRSTYELTWDTPRGPWFMNVLDQIAKTKGSGSGTVPSSV